MPLSNLPGVWRWEEREHGWWRIHDGLCIEQGPYTEPPWFTDLVRRIGDDIADRTGASMGLANDLAVAAVVSCLDAGLERVERVGLSVAPNVTLPPPSNEDIDNALSRMID